MTDVEAQYRKAPSTELAERMKLPEAAELLLESTEEEFYLESEKILAETSKRFISAGTSAGQYRHTVNVIISLITITITRTRQHVSATSSVAKAVLLVLVDPIT